jgi:6-phosphogluconate dehydrogenase (decarboxylating)
MTIGIGRVTERPAWQALEDHHRNIRAVHLRDLSARDPGRGERLTAEAAGVYLDDRNPSAVTELVSAGARGAASLGELVSNRGEADFQNQLLSAMRYQFGGHVGKAAHEVTR